MEQGTQQPTPKRSTWRMVREVFVAGTDAEALRLSACGMMGRTMTEYLLPLPSPEIPETGGVRVW